MPQEHARAQSTTHATEKFYSLVATRWGYRHDQARDLVMYGCSIESRLDITELFTETSI